MPVLGGKKYFLCADNNTEMRPKARTIHGRSAGDDGYSSMLGLPVFVGTTAVAIPTGPIPSN
jgi:hypothetical protein